MLFETQASHSANNPKLLCAQVSVPSDQMAKNQARKQPTLAAVYMPRPGGKISVVLLVFDVLLLHESLIQSIVITFSCLVC